MAKDDKTVFDPGATRVEGGTTIIDGYDISTAAENAAIAHGDTLLSTYTVESDAIEGGMGSVWRVHHKGWNVDLAMKRPKPALFQTEGQVGAFIHECEAWIDLGLHPNIVSCYYVRNLYGVPTIFSEWMDGGSLESAISKGALYVCSEAEQQERILDIAIQFARGLHYAHEAGLIHQDVKPDNLLLTKSGEAKVADFGLAQARAHLTVLEGELTMNENPNSGRTIISPSGGYTPAYCSMEQMDGKALTRRTDIYSWAVSVMEMYIGSRPWANGVVAGLTCQSYFDGTRVPVPEALKELLAKCMDAEPENRPHDFAEVEAKLHEVYRAETGADYPRPVPKAAADTADSLNNRALSFLDLGKAAEAERLWEMAIEKDTNNGLAAYNKSLHLWRSGAIDDTAAISAVRARDSALLPALENERASTELSRCGEAAATNIWVGGFALSHSGKQMLLIDCNPQGSPQCKLVDTATMDVERCLYSRMYESYLNCAAFTPDDAYILTAGLDGLVLRWDAAAGKPVDGYAGVKHPVYPDQRAEIYAIDVLKDGSGFVTGDGAGNFITRRFGSEGETRIIPTDSDRLSDICVSTDGSLVAAAGRGAVYLFETETGRLIRKLPEGKELFTAVLFTGDGKTLMTGGSSGRIWLFDVETGARIREIVHHKSSVQNMDINPDGTLLLSTSISGVKLHELGSGRCLCTYGEGMGLSERVCAQFARDGNSVLLSRSSGVVARYAFPSGEAAPFLVAKIAETKKVTDDQRAFEKAMAAAREAFGESRYTAALRSLERARAIPAYRDDMECVALNFALSKHLTIRGVRGVIPFCGLQHDGVCYGARSLADGDTFITEKYRELRYWRWSTGERIKTVPIKDSTLHGFAVSSDGALIAYGDYQGNVSVMDMATQKVTRMPEPYHKRYHEDDLRSGGIQQLAFSPDGRKIYSMNDENHLDVWDVTTGHWERTLFSAPEEGNSIIPIYAGFDLSRDGNTLLIAIGGIVRIEDLGGARRTVAVSDPRFTNGLSQMCLSPDASKIITVTQHRALYVWDARTGRCMGELEGRGERISGFTADWRFFLMDGRLYDMESFRMVYDISSGVSAFEGASISPSGESVLTRADNGTELALWRIDYDVMAGNEE